MAAARSGTGVPGTRRPYGFWPWAWLVLGILVGCVAAPPALPTRMPVAALPGVTATATAVPPSATPTPTATATQTVTPTPSPTSSPTPTGTPTPDAVPPYLVDGEIVVPYLERPPRVVACDGSGILFRSRYPGLDEKSWRTYTAYLPPCYGQQGRTYPVLYLFHGSIQSDTHWVDLGLASLVDDGIQQGRYPPFIAVMPNNGELGNKSSGGDRSIEGLTVDVLVPFIDAHYCTWATASGRSLGGISRGGYWALMIAFRHTDLFTSVAGHSSHLRYETDSAQYNPLSTFATADFSQMRIWLDWGEKDFLYYGQKTLHESLTAAGILHEVHMNEGGHNERYWLAHIREYLDWQAAAWPLDPTAYPRCVPRQSTRTEAK